MKLTTWHEIAEDLNGDPRLEGLTDEQITAMIDALAMTIYADDKVAPLEVAGFNHLLFNLPWLEDRHEMMVAYIPTASHKARTAHEQRTGTTQAADISRRLGDDYLRERVFMMATSLAQVDMTLDEDERRSLEWLAEAFGLDDARRLEISERVRR